MEEITGEELERLVREHDALRRVATLVSRQPPQEDVFAAVTRETVMLLDARMSMLLRVESPTEAVVLAAWSQDETLVPVGSRGVLDGRGLVGQIMRTGRPVRIDDFDEVGETVAAQMRQIGVRAGVAGPVMLGGRIWGALSAAWPNGASIPVGAAERVAAFAELVSYAIDNAETREDLRRLADEQAALRRIATLVAQGADARAVFAAVAKEVAGVLGVRAASVIRYKPGGNGSQEGLWGDGVPVPVGASFPLERNSASGLVWRTGRTATVDLPEVEGEIPAKLTAAGLRSAVAVPVVVEGTLWGCVLVLANDRSLFPAAIEDRLRSFTELIATAIANTQARDELIASRARIVEAAFEQRRRVVRDLHDGAQQRLVHAVMTLQLARGQPDVRPEVAKLVGEALDHTSAAIEELRELAHGLHPALLTTRGIAAAVEGLADRSPVPVRVDIPKERYPASVESAAYFVAAEALTNVAKYARASTARVTLTRTAGALVLVVEDDGVGGATRSPGSGLAGLQDRIAAFDGTLTVDSPPGAGTRVRAEIPLRPGGQPSSGG